MKKIVAIVILIVLLFVAYSLYKIGKEKIGDIRPALLPSQNLADKIIESQKVGEKPTLPITIPSGYSIGVFAKGVTGARDLQFTEGGTLLVSLMASGEVWALPDRNNDGVADEAKKLLTGLRRPHGLAFYNGQLFVAEETKVTRYSFDEADLIASNENKLFDLPSGGRHFSRSLLFDRNGSLYISLGSTCDTCVEKEEFISTVLISDSKGKKPRVYSRGLRNAVFLALKPNSNEIFVTEMGRDFLGDDSPPDEINVLKDGADYGWPFCYGMKVTDRTQREPREEFCQTTESPFYEIPAHSAPLGLAFIQSPQFDDDLQGDLLVSYHGSWNRSTPSGYKVVKISMKSEPYEEDFITGFLQGKDALGRPVDLTFDKAGSLFISDDKAGAVYKMVKN